ncbi:MAG: hypothetical protein QOE61_3101 [Micromonosporaceae bacterium]|nr:hypothetical protein [Micromonosporaceae bacterium]
MLLLDRPYGYAEWARQAFLALPDAAAAGPAWTVRRWLEQWLSTRTDHCAGVDAAWLPRARAPLPDPAARAPAVGGSAPGARSGGVPVIAAGKTRSGRLLASSTVDRIRATLRTALADAVRQGLIETNPAGSGCLSGPLRKFVGAIRAARWMGRARTPEPWPRSTVPLMIRWSLCVEFYRL